MTVPWCGFREFREEADYERYYFGGRLRNKIISADESYFQADYAGIRQADDLLSLINTYVSGDPLNFDYFYTQRFTGVSGAVRNR